MGASLSIEAAGYYTGPTSPLTSTGTTSPPTRAGSPGGEGSTERGRIDDEEMLEPAARQGVPLDGSAEFSGRGGDPTQSSSTRSTEEELTQKFRALQIAGISGEMSEQKERGNTKKTETWEKLEKFLWQDLYYTAMADENMDDNTKILLMMCCPDKILEELKKCLIKDNNQEYNSYVELIKIGRAHV